MAAWTASLAFSSPGLLMFTTALWMGAAGLQCHNCIRFNPASLQGFARMATSALLTTPGKGMVRKYEHFREKQRLTPAQVDKLAKDTYAVCELAAATNSRDMMKKEVLNAEKALKKRTLVAHYASDELRSWHVSPLLADAGGLLCSLALVKPHEQDQYNPLESHINDDVKNILEDNIDKEAVKQKLDEITKLDAQAMRTKLNELTTEAKANVKAAAQLIMNHPDQVADFFAHEKEELEQKQLQHALKL